MTVIIGGGSAGLYYACLAKEKNPDENIILVEEHTEIGKPVQCTGILTDDIAQLIPKPELKRFVLNEINFTTVFSPSNRVTIALSTNYIIDNVAFIKYLHERAIRAGVVIMTGFRYVENKRSKIIVRDVNTRTNDILHDNRLIGADGPSSQVAKNNGLFDSREFLAGVQARVKIPDLLSDTIEFYPYIGEYAWSTPEGPDISRVGVASRSEARKTFEEFMKRYPGEIEETQGGPIPLHVPNLRLRKTEKEFSVTLIGDAATQIKNTTGGGIIPGMKAAKILADDFDRYERNLKPLNKELYLHYLLNKILKRYDGKDWDRLIRKVKSPSILRALERTNRDNFVRLLMSLALRPSMVIEGLRAGVKLI